ncbi:MAG TPA: AAA family ATPase [Streptosporangiaceae bacterium]|nr:AAA family ATPase [Streptosporangiaceae bacterium]
MLCPVLVGRAAEVDALAAALRSAAGGNGGLVVLAGEAGVGKSRLGREASRLATSLGFLVLTGRAAESMLPAPFRPITEALMGAARAGLDPDAPDVADYRPALGSLVPDWSRPGDTDAEISPAIVGEAVVRLLSAAGREGSLLVLEDLHWADPETLAILEHLAGSLAGTRVLCLATVRDSEPSAGLDAVRSIGAAGAASIIEVPRLDQPAVSQMAAACLGADAAPAAVTKLLRQCEGLPFAVEEFLAAAAASGELVSRADGWKVDDLITTAMPASILGSVRSRLAALDPAAGQVLVAAAVLGQEFASAMLPAVAEVTRAKVVGALRQACDVQLIEPVWPGDGIFRFRHSLTRNAILAGQLPPYQVLLSGRAADAIEQAHPGLPGAWCERAAELREKAGDRHRAAALRLEAGRRALDHGALHTAVTSLRDASELASQGQPADPGLSAEIDDTLVTALGLAGDYEQLIPEAERLIARLADAGADPRREAMVRIAVARACRSADPGTASAYVAAGRAIAGRLRDAELTSRADAAAARCAMDGGDATRAERLARRSLAAAEEAGQASWAAEVAVDSLQVIGRRERTRDIGAAIAAFERACTIADDAGLAIPRIDALHELGTIEMFDRGDLGRLSEASEQAHHAGAISTASVVDLKLGLHWALGSDLDRAQGCISQCEQTAHRIGASRVEALAASAQAFISGIRSDRPQAEQAALRAESVLPDNPEILFTTWGFSRVTASLFLGDLPRASKEIAVAVTHADHVPQSAPRLAWAYYALLHALGDDNGRAAVHRAKAESMAVRWNRGFFAYADAVLAGRSGHRTRAAGLAEDGHRLLATFAPRWNHLLRWLTAPAALADGWGEPLCWLREAAVGFEASGHDRPAAACRGMLRQAGQEAPRPRPSSARVPAQLRRLGVTCREMDVFRLVAQGMSNSQIAGRLFISPKTVDTHVASLVAKTGQTGRRELVAHAARLVPSETPLPRQHPPASGRVPSGQGQGANGQGASGQPGRPAARATDLPAVRPPPRRKIVRLYPY